MWVWSMQVPLLWFLIFHLLYNTSCEPLEEFLEEALHKYLEVSPVYSSYDASTYSYDVTKFLYVDMNCWYVYSSYDVSDDESLEDPSYILTFLSYDTSDDDLSKAYYSYDENSSDVFEVFSASLSN